MSFRIAATVVLFLALGVSAGAAEEQTIKITARARAACLSDAIKLCREAIPNVRNVLMCFGQHREQISNRCRVVLASYGLQ